MRTRSLVLLAALALENTAHAQGATPAASAASPTPDADAAKPKAAAPSEASTPADVGSDGAPKADATGPASKEPAAAEPAAVNAAPAATEDPADLQQLAAETSALGEDTPKLEFYGFADANYINMLAGKDGTLAQYVAPKPTFYVGHLNLYMASNLGRNWRSLAEVRFTYAPQFDENEPKSGTAFSQTDTTAADTADIAGDVQWSGIELQRAWIEYQPLDYLTVRFGQWLTPYGYWNDDHGSPTILAMVRPFAINTQFFPERQTGLQAYGKVFLGDWGLAYTVTVSNGRGPYSAVRDLDGNKAIGGRVELENSSIGDFSIGISAYRGKYTASTKRLSVSTVNGSSTINLYRTNDVAYQELSLGAEVRWLWKGLTIQGELLMNDAVYDDNARPRIASFDPRPALSANYRRWGNYLLLGYTLPWLELTPYAMGEYVNYTDSSYTPAVTTVTGGLNYRAAPNVVLKTEYKRAFWDGPGTVGLGNHRLQLFGAQVAWAF